MHRTHCRTLLSLLSVICALLLARALPAQDLFIVSWRTNEVQRYNGATGAFISHFAAGNGVSGPHRYCWGPDGNLYFTSGDTGEVKRFNGTTGAFIDTFVTAGSGGLSNPGSILFGPDGNLYVSSIFTNDVKRYNGKTGAYIDTFCGGNGINLALTAIFGPDGNLYVSSGNTNEIKKFDGKTGAYLGNFATGGGLSVPGEFIFGPDGNLYVCSVNSSEIKRYDGTTGAFIDNFVTAGSGGLNTPYSVAFGPDGNCYVSSEGTNEVKRYDGTTGAFIDNFITPANGGMINGAAYLSFQSAPAISGLITLDFDALPSMPLLSGSSIPNNAKLSDRFQTIFGPLFSSSANYVGVVALGSNLAISGNNGIGGATGSGNLSFNNANPITVTFWDPNNPTRKATTDYVSVTTCLFGLSENNVTLTAYDVDGNVVGSDSQPDIGGETLVVMAPGIYRVVFSGIATPDGTFGGGAIDNFTFDAVKPIQDPTTVNVSSMSGTGGQIVTLKASLFSNGSPLKTRSLRFKVRGVDVGSAITDSNGNAALNWRIPVSLGAGDIPPLF